MYRNYVRTIKKVDTYKKWKTIVLIKVKLPEKEVAECVNFIYFEIFFEIHFEFIFN